MKADKQPIRALLGKPDGRIPRGPPPMNWIKYVRGDLCYLSNLHEVFGTYV